MRTIARCCGGGMPPTQRLARGVWRTRRCENVNRARVICVRDDLIWCRRCRQNRAREHYKYTCSCTKYIQYIDRCICGILIMCSVWQHKRTNDADDDTERTMNKRDDVHATRCWIIMNWLRTSASVFISIKGTDENNKKGGSFSYRKYIRMNAYRFTSIC